MKAAKDKAIELVYMTGGNIELAKIEVESTISDLSMAYADPYANLMSIEYWQEVLTELKKM